MCDRVNGYHEKKSITEKWAFCKVNFNMSNKEFYNLSLEEFNALTEAHQQKLKEQEYNSALICSVLANINKSKSQKTYKPSDFMRQVKKKQSVDEMANVLNLIARAYQ